MRFIILAMLVACSCDGQGAPGETAQAATVAPQPSVACGNLGFLVSACHCSATKCGTWATATVPKDEYQIVKGVCDNGQVVNRPSADVARDMHFGPGDPSCGSTGECWSLGCGTPSSHYDVWYRRNCAPTWGNSCGASTPQNLPCCPSYGFNCMLTRPGTPSARWACCRSVDSNGFCL